jgi:hypothetical protein
MGSSKSKSNFEKVSHFQGERGVVKDNLVKNTKILFHSDYDDRTSYKIASIFSKSVMLKEKELKLKFS